MKIKTDLTDLVAGMACSGRDLISLPVLRAPKGRMKMVPGEGPAGIAHPWGQRLRGVGSQDPADHPPPSGWPHSSICSVHVLHMSAAFSASGLSCREVLPSSTPALPVGGGWCSVSPGAVRTTWLMVPSLGCFQVGAEPVCPRAWAEVGAACAGGKSCTPASTLPVTSVTSAL